MRKQVLAVAAVLALGTDARAWWGNSDPPPLPSSPLANFRSSAADPSGVGGSRLNFSDPIYATPLPPRPGTVVIPGGGPLVAPVITPVVGPCGLKFDVIRPGCEGRVIRTKDPQAALDSSCGCGPGERVWFGAEFLYWATQGVSAPPLFAAGPATAAVGAAGIVGQPTTDVLFDPGRALNNFRPGLRLEAGAWFDPAGNLGAFGRFYFLGSVSDRFIGGANGINVLNAPQVVNLAGVPVQVPTYVAFPGVTQGTGSASVQTSFLGGDLNLRRNILGPAPWRVDVLGGYRYLQLGDHIDRQFDVVSATLPALVTPRLMGEDSVRTRNYFHGPQAGVSLVGRRGAFTAEFQTFLAMGVTVSDLDTSRTRVVSPGAAGLGVLAGIAGLPGLPFGPLVQTGGRSQASYFAVVPEVGAKFGWQPVENLRVTFGYSMIYWSRVRRAQEAFDLSPTVRPVTTDFWAQGINGGIELRY